MLHAMNHSRPPSYKSHISDHPVIESGSVVPQVLQTTPTTTTVSGSGIRSSCTSEQIQVAQVHFQEVRGLFRDSCLLFCNGSKDFLKSSPFKN